MAIYELNLTQFNIFSELLVGVSLVYLIFYGILTSQKNKNYLLEILINDCILFIFLILCVMFFKEFFDNTNYLTCGESLIIDFVSFFFKYLIIISFCVCLIMIKHYVSYQKINFFEYAVIFLFSILSLFILCSTYDFLTAYLIIEFQSLTFYFLTASKKNSFYSVKSGLKYFILGSFSSGFLLLGISLSYGYTGSVNFKDLFFLFEKMSNPFNAVNYFNYYFLKDIAPLFKSVYSFLHHELSTVYWFAASYICQKYNRVVLSFNGYSVFYLIVLESEAF